MNRIAEIIFFLRTFMNGTDSVRDQLLKAYEDAKPGSVESIRAELALTKHDLTHARDAKPKTLKVSGIRVSEKGGINVFGLRRFPVNLYPAELLALCEAIESGAVSEFLSANESKLSRQKTEA